MRTRFSGVSLAVMMLIAACSKPQSQVADSAEPDAAQTVSAPGPTGEPSDTHESVALYDELPIDAPDAVAEADEDDPSRDSDIAAIEAQAVDLLEGARVGRFVESDTTNLFVTASQRSYAERLASSANTASVSATEESVPPPAVMTEPAPSAASGSTTEVSAAPKAVARPGEKSILEDRAGQWAVSAKASSTYAQTTGDKAGYSAWQATGAPNVSRYSDNALSWATKSGDSAAPEWLEVSFGKPVRGRAIRVRQNLGPGVISRIELIDEAGAAHEVWSGSDDTVYRKNQIEWFIREFPVTQYPVKGARITLLTSRVWGWNEIDAVQLVAAQ